MILYVVIFPATTAPSEDCVLLVPDTEVVVSPKVRGGTAVSKETKVRKPDFLPTREQEEYKPRFPADNREASMNSPMRSSSRSVSPSKWSWKEWVPWLLGVQHTSNRIQDPFSREHLRKKSIDYKRTDTIPEGLNFTFRVQPRSVRETSAEQKTEEDFYECHFLQQPAIVFVNAEDIIEQTGNMNLHIPGTFLARLSKLLSPKVQMTEIEKELNEEKNKGKSKAVQSPKFEPSGVSRKEKDHLTQCVVRVVVLDRKKANSNEDCEDMLQAVTEEQPLLCHHVVVSDLLRRLMKLDATSCVWLHTIGTYPITPTTYHVHPVGSLVSKRWQILPQRRRCMYSGASVIRTQIIRNEKFL